jgi:hypothetical protein
MIPRKPNFHEQQVNFYVVDLEILFCQMCSGLSLIWNRIQLTYGPKNLHGAQ